MTRHTLNGRLLQYTIAPEFRGNWRMRKLLKPGSPAIIREPRGAAPFSARVRAGDAIHPVHAHMRICMLASCGVEGVACETIF